MDFLPDVIMPENDIAENGTLAEREAEEPEPEPAEEQTAEKQTVEVKRKMEQVDIFADAPKVKQVKEKKKRVLSEEHKQKLANAREKALAVRRANSHAKKEMKDLTKLKKKQDLDKLREETGMTEKKVVIDNPIEVETFEPVKAPIQKPPPLPVQHKPIQVKQYTQEDLDKTTLNAIIGYEKIRKERKSVKKKEQNVVREQEALKQQLRNIKVRETPQYESNPWSDFF